MKFKLDFSCPKIHLQFGYETPIISLGSCFSDEIAKKLSFAGFNVVNNPFGVLFHPLSIANVLYDTLNKTEKVDVYQRDDLFFSWEAASKIYGLSKGELEKKILSIRTNLLQTILQSKLMILTFGSAFQYSKEDIGIVGNCHKAPQTFFEKKLTNVEQMFSIWEKLINDIQQINPDIQFLLTVSPVRHIKDGLIDNNRSKSRLIELVHQLADEMDNVYYFPSYEILIDELRDYRFYANDLVHPSQQAVDYIWEMFKSSTMNDVQLDLVKRVEKIKHSFNHKSLHPESKATQKFNEKLREEKENLEKENKYILW